LLAWAYYPVLTVALVLSLSVLYKVALPNRLPWRRGLPGALLGVVVFLVATAVLRLYISWVTGTGYTYGALAAPIAFLLATFFFGMGVVLGAQLNNAIQELWPAPGPVHPSSTPPEEVAQHDGEIRDQRAAASSSAPTCTAHATLTKVNTNTQTMAGTQVSRASALASDSAPSPR